VIEEVEEMAFEELKQRQGVVWGAAPFEVCAETIADVHEAVVEAVGVAGGKRWLDVACGTGGVTELAARGGAEVTGIDLAPALIETAKRRAADEDLDIDYRVGDAENLDVADSGFDVVTSTFGVIFAPDQQRAAAELGRVTGSGGTLALSTWTPDGGIGAMFDLLAEFQPPLPDGAGAPLDWGRPDHVEELIGDSFDVSFETRTSTDTGESGESMWQLYLENFGPLKTLAGMLDDGRREELHQAWVGFFENYRSDGGIEYPREWLLVTGTRR
jgi:SAM-dependent methyltransferase